MKLVALVAWILTAAAGAYLFAVRIAGEGLRRPPIKITRYPTALTVSHPMLALVAMAVWVEFIVTSRTVYAWSAFAMLVLVVLLGFVLLTRWLIGRGGKHARDAGDTLPYTVMLVHGAVAIITFVLVLLAALMVGR